MASSAISFYLVAAVFLFGIGQFGSALKIEVSKQYVDDVVATSFNIRCTPEMELDSLKYVVLMTVSREDGKTIASIQGNDRIYYDRLLKSTVGADGHLDVLMNKTFFSVTFGAASEEDSGLYQCTMHYIDQMGRLKQKTASHNLTIVGYDMHDMLRHFVDKVLVLDNFVKDQQEKLSAQQEALSNQEENFAALQRKLSAQENVTSALEYELSAQHKKLSQQNMVISSQQEEISAQQEKLSAQEAKLSSHEEILSHLRFQLSTQHEQLSRQEVNISHHENALTRLELKANDKSSIQSTLDNLNATVQRHEADMLEIIQNNSFTTFFSYRYGSHKFAEDQVLIYKKRIMGVGNSYDANTGVFTAPKPGLYVFHISACDEVDLMVNGARGTKVATLFTDGADGSTQSSMSTIVYLNAGDKLAPYLVAVSGGTVMCADDYRSAFSGYLLKMM